MRPFERLETARSWRRRASRCWCVSTQTVPSRCRFSGVVLGFAIAWLSGSWGYCQATVQGTVVQDSPTQESPQSLPDFASRTTTVGMPARIVDLILPGPALQVIPIERKSPVVVRILQTIGHGPDQHRYELEYYCLEPGQYNLADYLQQSNGEPADVPAIQVQVVSQLGDGQVKPNELQPHATPRVGGYQIWLIAGGIAWLVGLLAIMLVGRQRLTAQQRAARQLSLAERLQPLVEQAMQGDLAEAQQAELERMLLTYWRQKLDLNDATASNAMVAIRDHETAGQLLRQLEAWLHMPVDRRQDVNISELLKPYRHVAAELSDLDAEATTR